MSEEKNLHALNFAKDIPKHVEPYVKGNDTFRPYGKDNLYPYSLLDLYNGSPIHSSIINTKANFIYGAGLLNEENTLISTKVNSVDDLQSFTKKVILDFLLFNYFCVEVIYNIANEPIEYHFVPAHLVRTNNEKDKFWYFEDLKNYRNKYVIYDRYRPNSDNSKSKIFYYEGYRPSANLIYPSPDYEGTIKSIWTDIAIRDFNLNNIKHHFSVSTIITMFLGSNVSEEVKRQILRDIKDCYTGEHGQKVLLDFQNPGGAGQAAEVKNISPNDWDKTYEAISRSVVENIYQGHSITNPMLFGVKTEGQLGGATELETSYEIYKANYIIDTRNSLTAALNYLFSDSKTITGKVQFGDKKLFSTQIDSALKEKIYTINELRKEANLPELPDGNRFLTDTESKPVVLVKEPKSEPEAFHLTELDFDKIKDMGISAEDFESVEDGEFIVSREHFSAVELKFDEEQDISNYILDKELKSTSVSQLRIDIRKDLGINISTSDLESVLKRISGTGILKIEIKDGKVNINPPAPKEPSRKVEVMYSYEVRPGLGEPIQNNTRPFCRRLIQNNRFYTRQDIQRMTEIFGYDIFRFGGGFYRNPRTGELTPFCRHQFKSKRVTRKNKK